MYPILSTYQWKPWRGEGGDWNKETTVPQTQARLELGPGQAPPRRQVSHEPSLAVSDGGHRRGQKGAVVFGSVGLEDEECIVETLRRSYLPSDTENEEEQTTVKPFPAFSIGLKPGESRRGIGVRVGAVATKVGLSGNTEMRGGENLEESHTVDSVTVKRRWTFGSAGEIDGGEGDKLQSAAIQPVVANPERSVDEGGEGGEGGEYGERSVIANGVDLSTPAPPLASHPNGAFIDYQPEWLEVQDYGYGLGYGSRARDNLRRQQGEEERDQAEREAKAERERVKERERQFKERPGERPFLPTKPRRGAPMFLPGNGGSYERGGPSGRRGRGGAGFGRAYGNRRGGYQPRPPFLVTPPPHFQPLPDPGATIFFSPPHPPPQYLAGMPGTGYEAYVPLPPLPMPPLPASLSVVPFPLDPLRLQLLGQLEYYLSPQNMVSDFFLRQRVR
jgi:hypothetical protein